MNFLAALQLIPQLLQLVLAIFTEVHNVQAALPGAPGADKSANVIAKVTPIADVVGAETQHVQSIIDLAVDLSKKAGLGAFGAHAEDQAGA